MYPSLHHLSALQREGLKVWDAIEDKVLDTHPFFALMCADGPGMASVSGNVGHHGKKGCRIHCPMTGRHKPGVSHYYPARFKPHNYSVVGCDHGDIPLGPLLDSFDPEEAAERYHQSVKFVGEATNKTEYEKRRLETGISKPCVLSGLPSRHTLGLPACLALDAMHAPCLNAPDLFMNLWRGKFECEKTDSKELWDWVVLTGDTWKRHGQAVADITKYIPGCFDRPPRNPAEKLNSGYKAWEHLLYFFGLGPALFYGILPDKYYRNYCKMVHAVRVILQEETTPEERLMTYVCGRGKRIKFSTRRKEGERERKRERLENSLVIVYRIFQRIKRARIRTIV
ncbi:hypothetical protein C8R47DRAFT_978015 [Mycena vitilis]|nr:hypothetical protein C8R47DRAFT_978015 [Mycena vitilis]